MGELLAEVNPVVECVAYADDLFILVERNSRLEPEQRGTECMYIGNMRSLKVGVAVSMLLKGNLFRPPIVKLSKFDLPTKSDTPGSHN